MRSKCHFISSNSLSRLDRRPSKQMIAGTVPSSWSVGLLRGTTVICPFITSALLFLFHLSDPALESADASPREGALLLWESSF